MNTLHAVITAIDHHESLCFLEVDASGITLGILLFDLNPCFMVGSRVEVLFKETEVVLAKGLAGEVSFTNRFSALISSIKSGCMLADITLQTEAGELSSIITMRALEKLGLKNNDKVMVLIKASQLSLGARRDDSSTIE